MNNKPITIFLALSLVAAFRTPTSGFQKQKPADQETIRISAQLVQIDVLVTDKSNHPVTGLNREDFEIYDNNKPQHITHFAYENASATSVSSPTRAPSVLPRTITAAEVKRVIAFVVDTLHMKPESVYRTRQMLEKFLESQMQPGDLVVILPTAGGSGLLQQFTTDQRMLRRAIDRLRPFFFTNDTTPHRSLDSPFGQNRGVGGPGGMNTGGRTPGGRQQPRFPQLGHDVDPLEEADVRATLASLNNLVNSMRQLPGRKLALLVSEGMRIFQTDTSIQLHETTDLAARANVVFYTVDPRGLDPLSINAADDVGDQDPLDFLNSKRDDFRESQDSLNAIALDTGGKFFRDNNDIKRGLTQMLEENSGYYVLGFQPEAAKWDGKYHKIKVAVRGRTDLTVSFRKGYIAADENPKAKENVDPKVAENVAAINSPFVQRDIDLRLTPFYSDDQKRDLVMVTLLHIDASQLRFNQVEGRYHDKLDLIGFVLDANGKTVDGFSDVLELNLLPERYQLCLKNGLVSTRTLAVKPGVYQMRVLVREPDTGKLGTANDFIEVPDLKSDRLSMSSIFVTPPAGESGKPVESAGQGATLSQRRYKRGSQMEYYFVTYNAATGGGGSGAQLEEHTRVLKAGRAVFTSEPRMIKPLDGSVPPKRILAGGVLTFRKLDPGDYTLEIRVVDKSRKKESRAVARQELDFSIE